jgi:hypothetical protein
MALPEAARAKATQQETRIQQEVLIQQGALIRTLQSQLSADRAQVRVTHDRPVLRGSA